MDIVNELRKLLGEIDIEYNKMEDIFDEYFNKDERNMNYYYTQKEATSLMQELSWVKGRIETILERSSKDD